MITEDERKKLSALCSFLLAFDVATVVDRLHRDDEVLAPNMSRARAEATRRYAVALLASRGEAQNLRDVVVAEAEADVRVWSPRDKTEIRV